MLKSWKFGDFGMLKGVVFFSGGRFWGSVVYSVNEYTRDWKGAEAVEAGGCSGFVIVICG
jgi:hypothetical protein